MNDAFNGKLRRCINVGTRKGTFHWQREWGEGTGSEASGGASPEEARDTELSGQHLRVGTRRCRLRDHRLHPGLALGKVRCAVHPTARACNAAPVPAPLTLFIGSALFPPRFIAQIESVFRQWHLDGESYVTKVRLNCNVTRLLCA